MPDGNPVASFTLTFVNEDSLISHGGGRIQRIDIVATGWQVLECRSLLRKESKIQVEGSIRQRRWTTREGVIREKVEIVARRLYPWSPASRKDLTKLSSR
jgi:single-stranded DNA-binding protein